MTGEKRETSGRGSFFYKGIFFPKKENPLKQKIRFHEVKV